MKLLNILTIGAVAAGLTLTSCSESFLDVESMTESNTENFYKTENDAYRALIGCYDGWRQIASNPSIGIYIAATVMSDECYGASGNGDGFGYQVVDRFDNSLSPSDMNLYEGDWQRYYEGIYRCNVLLSYDDQIQWTSEANRSLYLSECRALRALMYFDLARMFENIPFFLEPSTENREQADPDEVYAWVLEDLRYAVNNIPATANHGASDFGRITKQTAEGILARAYMYYTGYYGKQPGWTDEEAGTVGNVTQQEALAAVEDAISSGYYQLIPKGEFNTLWPAASLVAVPGPAVGWDPDLSTYAGDANDEVMLAMTFTPGDWGGKNFGNSWQVLIGMRNLWQSPLGRGWGIGTVCPNFLDIFPSGDTRLKASVIDIAGEGLTDNELFQSSYTDWREYTGYCIKKYSPYCYNNTKDGAYQNGATADGTANFQIGNTQPWIFLRYADVLLMAAELGSGNAQSYLDQVRDRAGLSTGLAPTKENILAERARELAFEGHRYWDLLRQRNGGQVTALVDALMAVQGPVKNGGLDATVTYDASKILATNGLCQIPNNQITLSNYVLKQNPGWY